MPLPADLSFCSAPRTTRRLADPFCNDPCSVAALARLVRRLASFLVHLFARPMAFRADVLAGPRRAGLRIIVGRVVPGWVLRVKVVGEVARDLTKIANNEVAEHLKDVLFLPA
jgi:hypothetical protein